MAAWWLHDGMDGWLFGLVASTGYRRGGLVVWPHGINRMPSRRVGCMASTCLNQTLGLPDQKGGSLTVGALSMASAGRRLWIAEASAWMSEASNGIMFLELPWCWLWRRQAEDSEVLHPAPGCQKRLMALCSWNLNLGSPLWWIRFGFHFELGVTTLVSGSEFKLRGHQFSGSHFVRAKK